MATEKLTFDSISDIPRWIDAHPREMLCDDSESYNASESWDLNTNYEQAIDYAKRGGGWDEGAKQMKKITLEMADLKTEGRVTTLDTDVAGFAPDVESYLAGDPCNMWQEHEGEGEVSRVISIGMNVGMSAGCTSTKAMNYGAAIMSAIDEIENTGARVELWAVWACRKDGDRVDFRVLLKGADEHWSPASVAFALCHPAMSRRLMFRVTESFKSLTRFAVTCGKGYEVDDLDVYYPYLLSSDSDWANKPATALKRVAKMTQEQLNQLEDRKAA